MEECSSCGEPINEKKDDYTIHEITTVKGDQNISLKFLYCLTCTPDKEIGKRIQ